MYFKAKIKKTLERLDQFSPYPLLYPFIMSDKEKAIFDQTIKKSRHYLEFGLGGSTIRAIQKSRTVIYTVESSYEWINYMRKYMVIRHNEGNRLHIFSVDNGPTRAWGYPESNNPKDSFESLSSSIFQHIDTELIDLVLVDGRYRVACTLKSIQKCHKNERIKIMIHDFWNRPHYHVVLNYLDNVDEADSIGLFSIKKSIDLKLLEKDYDKYKYIPE